MDQVYLFGLASRRAEWLATRQSIVAENIANVNTPAYKSKDIEAFSDTLEKTQLQMAGTAPYHLASVSGREIGVDAQAEDSWGVLHSGNSVSLEQEMLKGGEVSAQYSLNASIVKAFHRFFLTSVKG